MEVLFDNRQDKLEISESLKDKIKKAIASAVEVEQYNENIEVSVSFVDNEEIQNINKEFRNVDRATDVLSFPTEFEFEIEGVNEILGDIIISAERANEQAVEFDHSFEREMVYLAIHSMFHLFGYDHMDKKDKKIMREKEKETIRNIGIYKRNVYNKENVNEETKKFKNINLIESFNHAIDGLIHSFKNENNFKRHIGMALLVAIISLFFDISRLEMAVLCITITLVMLAELLNTALENVVDLVYDKYEPRAKIAKDVGAGAVLVTALNSIFVGYFIFYDRIIPLTNSAIFKIQNSPVHLTFIALVIVILVTLIFKSIFYKGNGTHFQGGTVSGHSALAFCLATIITFLSNNALVTLLSFLLAILVAESRVEGKIHSLSEVIFGGITGILIAIIIFKLLVLGG